jgi:uncharacterized protein (TIGR02145 family)
MYHLKRFLKIAFISLVGLMMAACQKQDVNTDTDIELKALSLELSITTDYLLELKGDIVTMMNNGLLGMGNANALIVKINNAIKSIAKGNITASDGQLHAFINEAEEFIAEGIIPMEEGQELINSAENAIILSDGGFTDPRDGYKYPVVLIGEQLWMAENLKATKYNDGTAITYPGNINTVWQYDTAGAYAWYNNDESTNKNTYGALYNWYAVNRGNLCPTGWHVPTQDEWEVLTNSISDGGYMTAGGPMKESGTMHWLSPNSGATNESGFNGLPGGMRDDVGEYYLNREFGYWWTGTEYPTGSSSALYRLLRFNSTDVNYSPTSKTHGFSVRCIKN